MKRLLRLCAYVLCVAAVGSASAASLTVTNSATACSRNCVETMTVKGGMVVVLKSASGEVLAVRNADIPSDAVFVGTSAATTTPLGNGAHTNATTPVPGGGTVQTQVTTYITATTIIVVTVYTFVNSMGVITDIQVTVNRFPRAGMAN